MTYIKETIITKLQKLYSPPRNPTTGNKSPMLFMKKALCVGKQVNYHPHAKYLLKGLPIMKFWSVLVLYTRQFAYLDTSDVPNDKFLM